jgi:hypothetical protein
MWEDFEAKNKLLEDLLVEYATKLDSRNTKIESLKREITALKHEIKYYKDHYHSFPGNIYERPEIVDVPDTKYVHFNLRIPIVQVELNSSDHDYHVIARLSDKGTVRYSYYITKESLISSTARLSMLAYLHKKVLDEIESQLKKTT